MSFRDVFQQYIESPEKHKSIMLHYDDDVIIIEDKFSKALRHYLVIPRSKKLTHIHPLLAFKEDPECFFKMESYVNRAKDMILESLFDSGILKFERSDISATADFRQKFISSGVHSVPSLRNLHIHVITRDFFSPRLKNKKHYNSFTTSFFVEFESLLDQQYSKTDALSNTDSSTDTEGSGVSLMTSNHYSKKNPVINEAAYIQVIKSSPLKCTYCGKSFGNKFKQLKEHLEEEFNLKFNKAAYIV